MEIVVSNLSKTYRRKKSVVEANKNISLIINKGDFLGIFGSNGSGKTTLIREILRIIEPDEGEITVRDRERIGYMAQSGYAPFYNLKVKEALDIVTDLHKLEKSICEKMMKETLRYFSIKEEILESYFYQLSGGQRRILYFAFALLGEFDVLVLDEPSNDLDPENRYLLWNKIKELNMQGKTILLVTHNLTEVENHISRFVFLKNGEIILDEKQDLLREYNSKQNKLLLYFKDKNQREKRYDELTQCQTEYQLKKISDTILVIICSKEKSEQVLKKVGSDEIDGYKLERITLEDICFG